MENRMEVSQKIKNRTAICSRNSSSGYLSEGNKITVLKRYLHPHVHCSIIYNSQDMGTTLVSIMGWMDKENVKILLSLSLSIYIYSNIENVKILVILFSHKKEGNLAICKNMDMLMK